VKKEHKVTGRAACAKILESRLDDVIRLYVTEDSLSTFRPWLKQLAGARKAYHVVTEEDLRKVTESVHHEGVCLVVKSAAEPTLDEALAGLPPEAPAVILYLENVGNPHNVGAIVRVAAHFGVRAVCVDADAPTRASLFSAAFHRTAEGGAEAVPVIPVESARSTLSALKKAGFTFVATSSHANRALFGAALPARTVLLLGSEAQGLTALLTKEASLSIAIPGTGEVESLNVATATASLLTEYYRQHLWARRPD
jgi:TrmH RNA methyltransferase